MASYDTNGVPFNNNTESVRDVYGLSIGQMVQTVSSDANVSVVSTEPPIDGPMPSLGIDAALQEQLLDGILPPSTNFPPGPPQTDECGFPSTLPGEFPLSLLPVELKIGDNNESTSMNVPLDKIEATISMNESPMTTLTNAVPMPRTDGNLIVSSQQILSSAQVDQQTAQQDFNLNYNCQQSNTTSDLVLSVVTTQTVETEPIITPSQTSMQSQQLQQSIVPLQEAQLPPSPISPSTSMAVFQQTQRTELITEMLQQNQLNNSIPSQSTQTSTVSLSDFPPQQQNLISDMLQQQSQLTSIMSSQTTPSTQMSEFQPQQHTEIPFTEILQQNQPQQQSLISDMLQQQNHLTSEILQQNQPQQQTLMSDMLQQQNQPQQQSLMSDMLQQQNQLTSVIPNQQTPNSMSDFQPQQNQLSDMLQQNQMPPQSTPSSSMSEFQPRSELLNEMMQQNQLSSVMPSQSTQSSISEFQPQQNELMSDMMQQNQMTQVLPSQSTPSASMADYQPQQTELMSEMLQQNQLAPVMSSQPPAPTSLAEFQTQQNELINEMMNQNQMPQVLAPQQTETSASVTVFQPQQQNELMTEMINQTQMGAPVMPTSVTAPQPASITVFESQQNKILTEMLQQNQLTTASSASLSGFNSQQTELINEMIQQSQLEQGLTPPPPLQPVQQSVVKQSGLPQMREMDTFTNLVPVETQSQINTCGPISVVVKMEPQSDITNDNNSNSNMNDDNNNPIIVNSRNKDKDRINCLTATQTSAVNNTVRSFPLCVISSTAANLLNNEATNNTLSNNPRVYTDGVLTLPPKKAKFGAQSFFSSKASSQAVPSTGMTYDLPQNCESSISSHNFRVQSGFPQTSKIQHNLSQSFTTVSPIFVTGLMPPISIDAPISLVKDEKMRQLITSTPTITSHPDYPAISGLLSFIKPEFAYHPKTLMTTMPSQTVTEIPLSLSIKNNLSASTLTPITSVSMNHHMSSGQHVPSSQSRPNVHHNQHQQTTTSATSVLHTQPTAVPVSVVTSVVDHHKGVPHKFKNIGQNGNRSNSKVNDDHNTSGSSTTGSKLQLAPLLSGDPAKPFQCALCGKHLASKNVYQLHLRSHSGEKPFTCNLCGHSFSQKTSLTRHMRSHTGERPFPCQVCGKRFADKERIKIHMRTHTGEKPFSCEVCGKQFSQKSTVKRHMSVHTGEKPFKCEVCGKGFANRGNLTAHTKTHSNS